MYKKDKEGRRFRNKNLVTTPFYSVLLKLLDESNSMDEFNQHTAERKLLIDCLTFVPKVGNKVVQNWIQETESVGISSFQQQEKEESSNTQEPIEVKLYSKVHFDSMPKLEGFERFGLNPILKEKYEEDYSSKLMEREKLASYASSEKANEEINAQPYCPNFLRPVPEVDQILEDSIAEDAIWLFPGVLPEPCWDYTLGNNTSSVKTLMKMSLNGPLKKEHVELICSTMRSDPEAVLHYAIHPSQLTKLVIHNKDLAQEFLDRMSSYSIIILYYDELIQTKVNLNSMELFNNLATTHDLPKEYILLYIHQCFESCKEESNADPKTKSTNAGKEKRLVRLVSILVDFLLKKKSIVTEELIQIKAVEFFEEHKDVIEANKIYKQLS